MPNPYAEAAIVDLVEMLRGRHSAPRVDAVSVELRTDAENPARTIVHIIGPTRSHVQHEIARCMGWVEDNPLGGFSNFINPAPNRHGQFESRGEVILNQPTEPQDAA